ncbi:MAG: hypothetical protein HZB57_08435 [Gammaproteobacteria bacterium]|nr:hypothetical protein [Gammaproteobacteria bacterium]
MPDRRLLLTRATKLLALLGAGFVIYVFISALLSDAGVDDPRKQRWEREIDVSALQPGELLTLDDWPGGPVAVYRRNAHELDGLTRVEAQLHDPQSQHSRQPEDLRTPTRSHLSEYFVFIPVDTDRACQLRYIPPNKQPKPDIAWYGGFSEPCNGSLYDTAGRVYRESRSERQQNLAVPAYIVIGKQRLQLTGINAKIR